MSFQSPWMLLGLLVLAAFVGLWLWLERRRARYAVRYTNLDVLATVVSGRSWARFVPAAILVLGLGALVIGLARPHVERTLLREKATVILVVDTSRSMQAEDVEPTRLGAAQEALRTFLDEAPDDLRVGLVVFAGEAQVATPPTDDHELVETAVTDIDEFLVFGGTAIGDALQTAVLLGRQVTDLVPEEGASAAPATTSTTRSLAQATEPDGDAEKSPVSILFLSDGAQTRGLLQPLRGRRSWQRRRASPSTRSRSGLRTASSSAARSAVRHRTRVRSFRFPPIPRRCARSQRRQAASSRRRARPTR